MHGYLRHLANFARIVEAGSMKSASEVLSISPSGLSESVKILENQLGIALLVRHKSGVTPTTEGERVYKSASGIVDLLNEALGPAKSDDLAQVCRVSVPTEVANTRFSIVVKQLVAHHPQISLKVFAEDQFVDHSRFARDYFLRIAPSFPADQELRTIWSGRATAILVASPELVGNVDTIERIERLTAIVSADRKPPFDYPLTGPKGRLTCSNAIGVSQPSARLNLAARGLGLTACIDFCSADLIQSGVLRRVLQNRFAIPLEVRLMTPHRRKSRVDAALAETMNSMLM